MIKGYTLDGWYREVNTLYVDRNFYRTPESILAHLVEVVGGLATTAADKEKPGVTPEQFVTKSITWWMTLCGRVGLRGVEELIWMKFPRACPYCQQQPCLGDGCKLKGKSDEAPSSKIRPDWPRLKDRAGQLWSTRPHLLSEWQTMFRDIYRANSQKTQDYVVLRLAEEMGELAEGLRLRHLSLAYFVNEAADVFAWLMALANKIDPTPMGESSKFLDDLFESTFSNGCPECRRPLCKCDPILIDQIGRLAQEVPHDHFAGIQGAIVSSDDYLRIFGQKMNIPEYGEDVEEGQRKWDIP